MPELSSLEVLQPSLLDRLTDSSRFIERLSFSWREESLVQAGISREECRAVLEARGLRREKAPARGHGGKSEESGSSGALEVWNNRPSGPSFRSLLELRPRPEAPTLSRFIELHERRMIPNVLESREERMISGRRLRQSVLRDLNWLLNTGQAGTLVDLDPYPEVQRSVFNYGIPDMTGLVASSVDPLRIAEGIRVAIQRFEPRIQQVVVTPQEGQKESPNSVGFIIEGMLWGQPMPERLYLHTELDLENASVTVRESASGDA
jgi:type VI secretion system protein ImpF